MLRSVRVPRTALAGIFLAGCIDQIDLAFDVPPDTRTILLSLGEGSVYSFPPDEVELVTARVPDEVVVLAQSLDELQLGSYGTIIPTGSRVPPGPDLGSMTRERIEGGKM
jgi:hypothetical protein